jgi:hypothetical protein
VNIFLIEPSTLEIADSLDDKRLFKQASEGVQILATVTSKHGYNIYKKDGFLFGSTHTRHPVVIWAGLCQANYIFTLDLAHDCLMEHARRFEHDTLEYYNLYHAMKQLGEFVDLFPDREVEYYALCLPEYIWRHNPEGKFATSLSKAIIAYRIYWLLHKTGGKYTNSSPPKWIEDKNLLSVIPREEGNER